MNLFSNFTLKMMAIIFMLMDHLYTHYGAGMVLTDKLESNPIPVWFGYFGKLAAPIFFYLIVEGFYHTKSRTKYMQRLFSMALLMVLVDVVFKIQNNIFLSLGLGVAFMSIVEYIKTKEKNSKEAIIGIILTIVISILSIFTEASLYGIGMVMIFYFLREKKLLMTLVYIVFSTYMVLFSIGSPGFYEAYFIYDYQWMMVFAIIPILFYNGKKGISNQFIKWLFYWFYPIHLIVIELLVKFSV